MSSTPQPGIALPVPAHSRYLSFQLRGADAKRVREALSGIAVDDNLVVGLGLSTVLTLNGAIPGLTTMAPRVAPGIDVPSTPSALWCWLRGDDRGELAIRAGALVESLAEAFALEEIVDGFKYGEGRDLTGYMDGTENPQGEDAARAAFLQGASAHLDGSSFVGVQKWLHDLPGFNARSEAERDNTFGRTLAGDVELDDAPPSAHVKRTAQEDFEPEAFVLRRSMPWVDGVEEGLVFVAFGHSLDAFDALMNRMCGMDDGITDSLFSFTRPLTGAYYWCPPLSADRLDLAALPG